jgi:cellulose biosynthesis protein BcsQ
MSVITIATTKGGAGKTSLARLILGRSALAGQKAAAIDADLNHTLTDWVSTVAKSPITIRHEVDKTKIVPLVAELHDSHDLVVIDTAVAASQATIFAIGCADLVLVPIASTTSRPWAVSRKLRSSLHRNRGSYVEERSCLCRHRSFRAGVDDADAAADVL